MGTNQEETEVYSHANDLSTFSLALWKVQMSLKACISSEARKKSHTGWSFFSSWKERWKTLSRCVHSSNLSFLTTFYFQYLLGSLPTCADTFHWKHIPCSWLDVWNTKVLLETYLFCFFLLHWVLDHNPSSQILLVLLYGMSVRQNKCNVM